MFNQSSTLDEFFKLYIVYMLLLSKADECKANCVIFGSKMWNLSQSVECFFGNLVLNMMPKMKSNGLVSHKIKNNLIYAYRDTFRP